MGRSVDEAAGPCLPSGYLEAWGASRDLARGEVVAFDWRLVVGAGPLIAVFSPVGEEGEGDGPALNPSQREGGLRGAPLREG